MDIYASTGLNSKFRVRPAFLEPQAAGARRRSSSTDEELSELLAKSDGIKIARRTVTKYRKLLGVPASSQRKQY